MKNISLVVVVVVTFFVSITSSITRIDPPPQPPPQQDLLAIRVDPIVNQLIDSAGRIRFFHGTNAVQKSPPWYPTQDYLNEERIQILQDMGFNALRLGTMWPGLETIRGSWNYTYVEQINTIVEQLASYGIYSLLDCHQDVYNERLCGEGFPDWSVNTNGKVVDPFAGPIHEQMPIDPHTGIPENCSNYAWASYYLTDAVGKSFQGLYENYNGLRDEFALFWSKVSQYFASSSSVLGYELINEPWCGDIFLDPELLLPEHADLYNLQPFYNVLVEEIRKVDQEHIIFYEPVTWVVTPAGFTQVPGGSQYLDRSVMSWHYYCWIFDPNDMSNVKWVSCHDIEGPDMFYQRTVDMKRIGGASFLTEWGANCDGQTPDGIEECNWVMDEAEKYLQSWTFWDLSVIFNGGSAVPTTVKLLSRSYPQAIAGVPSSFTFNSQTSQFEMIFTVNTTIALPTEIYLNEKLHYPNGYDVVVSPPTLKVVSEPNKVLLYVTQSTIPNEIISVVITPK